MCRLWKGPESINTHYNVFILIIRILDHTTQSPFPTGVLRPTASQPYLRVFSHFPTPPKHFIIKTISATCSTDVQSSYGPLRDIYNCLQYDTLLLLIPVTACMTQTLLKHIFGSAMKLDLASRNSPIRESERIMSLGSFPAWKYIQSNVCVKLLLT